jgi:hypothetical protein
MNIRKIFKHWFDTVQEDIQRRNFNEIQEEYSNEALYARMNGFDPLEWCDACKIGICETHLEFKIFTPDDSHGIEN